MSIGEEFKNSDISIFITKISDIILDFDKFDSLPRKITSNNKEITVLQGEINKINSVSSKDPFQFLKESNNLDIKKKKEIIIRNEVNDMKDELKNLSASIRDKLTTTTENEKSRIEADNAIANAKREEKNYKKLSFFSKCICGTKTV
jgi:sucrose-6-phosphate hydrolase SacC (GH32 family)